MNRMPHWALSDGCGGRGGFLDVDVMPLRDILG